MGIDPIHRALIDCIAFLELSGDDILNPDAAVSQLESISYTLKSLDPTEQRRLLDVAQQMAIECEATGTDPGRAQFLRSIPDHLGIQ